VGVIFLNTLYL